MKLINHDRILRRRWVILLCFVLMLPTSIFQPKSIKAQEWPAPTNLRVVSKTDTTVTLDWDRVEGAEEYNLYHGNGNYAGWSAGPPHTIVNLQPNTEYSFRVAVIKEPMSNLVTVTTDEKDPNAEEPAPVPPLSPPSYLNVTDMTDSSVTLSWGASVSPDTTSYMLYKNGEYLDGVWSREQTEYVVEDLSVTEATYGTYTFIIKAHNWDTGEESAASNAVTITLGELAAPRGLEVVTATRTAASLAWAPTPGATSYEIYVNGQLAGTSNDHRFVLSELEEGKVYTVYILAKNRTLTSTASEPLSFMPGKNYNTVAYYSSWSIYARQIMPTQIDVSKLTHINYAFADFCWEGKHGNPDLVMWDCQQEDIPLQKDYVFNGEMVVGEAWPDIQIDGSGNFGKLRQMKAEHPHLKTLISVGGWSWSHRFSDMAATEETRHAFANSAVEFIREYGFDGIDIDWEYPVEGGMDNNSRRPEDRENFVLLMQLVREKLDAAGQEDGKYYLLTIASGQGDNFVENANLAESSSYIDFINIMTYDYSGSWVLGGYHNAPLYYDPNNPSESAARNHVYGGVLGHLQGGVPPYKLVLGVPFYGKGWEGCLPEGQYQPCDGGAPIGTWEDAVFDFFDLEDHHYIDQSGYVRYWNDAAKVPYLYNETEQIFISYDDQVSLMYKTAMLKSLDLAGVMIWDISGDRNKTLLSQLANDLPMNQTAYSKTIAPPQNIRLASSGTHYLDIDWEASEGAAGYDIFVNHVWAGYAASPSFRVTSLDANTEYSIRVAAIEKTDEQITAVSIMSEELRAKTSSYPQWIGPVTSPVTGTFAMDITRIGDRTIVKLNTKAAVDSIRAYDKAHIEIDLSELVGDMELILSTEVIAAIAEKGEHASLSIILNRVEYHLPIGALQLGDNHDHMQISIQAPDEQTLEQMHRQNELNRLSMLVEPLEFIIEAGMADGTYTEVNDLGSIRISRVFKLDVTNERFDPARTTGVLYSPATDAYHHVPTIISVHEDGSVQFKLQRAGNSIYTVVASDFNIRIEADSWAKDDVEMSVAKLMIPRDGAAELDAHITRAEFVAVFVSALGILPQGGTSPFQDVSERAKYAAEIIAAAEAGLVKGRTADTFDPDGRLTREEMAVIIERAMRYAGHDGKANRLVLQRFSDEGEIAGFAKESMALMVEQRIMNGVAADRLAPKSNVTRAQSVVTAMRTLRALGLIE